MHIPMTWTVVTSVLVSAVKLPSWGAAQNQSAVAWVIDRIKFILLNMWNSTLLYG